MNDIKYLIEHEEEVRENLKNQNFSSEKLNKLFALDKKRKSLINSTDKLRQKLNLGTKSGLEIEQLRELSKKEKQFSEDLNKINIEFDQLMKQAPNLTGKNTPIGKDDSENKIIESFGESGKRNNLDHEEIMKRFNLVDIERAVKISGSRFYYLKNEAVELEFALVKYVIEKAKGRGYELIVPPVLMKKSFGVKAGHPEVEGEEAYHTQEDDLYLTASAEHSLMAMYSDEILENKKMPIRMLGFSSCFRREAGSYGKDVKGILRTHQFDKLELVSLTAPEDSEKEFDYILDFEKELMNDLGLPFRMIEICTGDISHAASRQVDIETWMPSQSTYRETHSCSNCTDYQTRGLGIKIREKENKVILAHALNATAFAIGRILIAIIENGFEGDYISIPDVLIKYISFDKIKLK